MRFTITARGLDKAQKRVSNLQKRISTYKEFFEKHVKPQIFAEFREIFDAEGPGWPPNKVTWPGKKILVRTGRLRKAYTTDNSDNIILIGDRQFSFRNLVPYAPRHELGLGVPIRPVVGKLLAKKRLSRSLRPRLIKYLMKE